MFTNRFCGARALIGWTWASGIRANPRPTRQRYEVQAEFRPLQWVWRWLRKMYRRLQRVGV